MFLDVDLILPRDLEVEMLTHPIVLSPESRFLPALGGIGPAAIDFLVRPILVN